MSEQWNPNQAYAPKKKSNKKIYLIIGAAVIIPILLVVGIIAIVVGALLVGSKSTAEYKCAIAEVKKNDKVIEMVGEPVEEGFYLIPNIEISGPRREVYFSTPVSGPKSSGTLYVTSYRDSFRSDFLMTVEADGENTTVYKGTYPCK